MPSSERGEPRANRAGPAMTEYTAWYIARLRDRLARFRAVETLNGRARTWARVANDIMETEGLPQDQTDRYWDQDEGDKILGEALRRFVDQQQVPNRQRLDAISLFLKAKGYLNDDDVQETTADFAAALALQKFLSAGAVEGDGALAGVYTASRRAGRSGSTVHTLEIASTDRPEILRFSETILYNPASMMREQIYTPGRLRTHAGERTERLEGWVVQGIGGTAFALIQDRLLGERRLFSIPHAERSEKPDESYLILVRAASYEAANPLIAAGTERALEAAADVGSWVSAQTWAYRYRAPQGGGG